MKLKKHISWLIVMALILGLTVLSGCGQKDEDGNSEGPVSTSVIVDLYFVNSEYMNTGDERLDNYLIDSREFQYSEDDNPWLDILNSLKSLDSDNAGTAITEDAAFKEIYVNEEDNNIMIVNLGSSLTGSSMQEGFFIGQIVKTVVRNSHLFPSSNNVDRVQFLVDGEEIESLMGHFDASEPFADESD